ncbi:MAG: hypothetical protein ACTSPB_00665 [Candidatus Thorarchaeota archaeon]
MMEMLQQMMKFLPEAEKERFEKRITENFIELLRVNHCEIKRVDGNSVDWELELDHPSLPESVRMYREDALFPDNMPEEVIEEYTKAHLTVNTELHTKACLLFFESEGIKL